MSRANTLLDDAQNPQSNDNQLNRRQLLTAGFWTSTGVMGVTLFGAGTRFLVGNAFTPQKEQWVKVDEVSNLPEGEVHKTIYSVREKDAWRRVERKGVLYSFTNNGVDFTVLSGLCTHMSCNVKWQAEKETFRCPCHDGYFDRDGHAMSGPPTEPLTPLQIKTEEGVLFALV